VTLVHHDRPTVSDQAANDADALIEEARRRQKRRKRLIAGVLAALAVTTTGIVISRIGGGPPRTQTPVRSTSTSSAPLTRLAAEFVAAGYAVGSPIAGDTSWGRELVVVATRTGRILRVIAHGLLGVDAIAGSHVFFTQLIVANGTTGTYEVSIDGGPVKTVNIGLPLAPSPNGEFLAYLSRNGRDLDVRDLARGTTETIAMRAVTVGIADPFVEGSAWMSPGNRVVALVRSNGPAEARLVIIGVRKGRLAILRDTPLPTTMTLMFLGRSLLPNTLVAAWVSSFGSSTTFHVTQIGLSARGVTFHSIGLLPAACNQGGVEDIDPGSQHVLCSSDSRGFATVDVVGLADGRYRVIYSTSADHFVITTAVW